MKPFHNICLSLIITGLAAGTAIADTALLSVFDSPIGSHKIFGGMIYRHVQYDSSHFKNSVAVAVRLTPGTGGITGREFDRGEVVARFSRGGIVYAECILHRTFNDDFDNFVSVQLAEHSPNSNAAENIIEHTVPASGKSRSFVSESVAFSTDNFNYFYKPNVGICNTNFGTTFSGTNIVGGVPNIVAGDTVDVYLLNMNNTSQPSAHLATGAISASNI